MFCCLCFYLEICQLIQHINLENIRYWCKIKTIHSEVFEMSNGRRDIMHLSSCWYLLKHNIFYPLPQPNSNLNHTLCLPNLYLTITRKTSPLYAHICESQNVKMGPILMISFCIDTWALIFRSHFNQIHVDIIRLNNLATIWNDIAFVGPRDTITFLQK